MHHYNRVLMGNSLKYKIYKFIYSSTTTSKYWPSIHSMHLPLQSRFKAFCGSIHTFYLHVWSKRDTLLFCACYNTLVNVYVDLLVFTRIAGTPYTESGRY